MYPQIIVTLRDFPGQEAFLPGLSQMFWDGWQPCIIVHESARTPQSFLSIVCCAFDSLVPENAKIGFEYLKYKSSESSPLEVCLVVNGTIYSSFNILVNTHLGTAGMYIRI